MKFGFVMLHRSFPIGERVGDRGRSADGTINGASQQAMTKEQNVGKKNYYAKRIS
jgi:hypothetical protein